MWVPEHGVFCGTHQLAESKEELSPALNKVPVAVEYSWMRLEFDVQDTFKLLHIKRCFERFNAKREP